MSDQLITAIVSIVLAIIGLAALATVLSNKAQTSQVIKAASSGLGGDIQAATNPFSGATPSYGGNGLT